MVGTPLQFVKKSPPHLDAHLFLKPSVVTQTAFIARVPFSPPTPAVPRRGLFPRSTSLTRMFFSSLLVLIRARAD